MTVPDALAHDSASKEAGQGISFIKPILGSLLVLFVLLWIVVLRKAWVRPFTFDDAYMFYRYAEHMRCGLGITWNEGGGHTYGPTSLLWTFCVFLLSFVPAPAARVLLSASWVCGALAVVAMGWAIHAGSRSRLLSHTWKATALIALPVVAGAAFRVDSWNGMETMLSVAVNALSIGYLLRWIAKPDRSNSILCAWMGTAAFLCRPDSALLFVLTVALAGLLLVGSNPIRNVVTLLSMYFGGLAVVALSCEWYFHSVLPFSFYAKSGHGYDGYAKLWYPADGVLAFLTGSLIFLFVLVLFSNRRTWRILLTFLFPALMAAIYYTFFVQQIMGYLARYYLPLLPFVVIPAMLALDRCLESDDWPSLKQVALRIAVFLFLCLGARPFFHKLERALAAKRQVYPSPERAVDALTPLPQVDWFQAQRILADDLMANLPANASIAATEVGYLGASLPGHSVFDLSGLNDAGSLHHEPMLQVMLKDRPDIIWLPVPDYTYLYGSIYSSHLFLKQYTVFDGVLNYGLAVRNDSPYKERIMADLATISNKIYPGYNIQKYVVRSVAWNQQKYPLPY